MYLIFCSEKQSDPYETHFDNTPNHLTESSRSAADEQQWKTTKFTKGKLGALVELVPEGSLSAGPSQSKSHGVCHFLIDTFRCNTHLRSWIAFIHRSKPDKRKFHPSSQNSRMIYSKSCPVILTYTSRIVLGRQRKRSGKQYHCTP